MKRGPDVVRAVSHNDALATLRWRCVRIFAFAHWTPHGWNEMVFGCFTVSDQAGTGLTDSDPWSREVISETLVVLREPAELQLGHRLFVRSGIHFGVEGKS